MPYIVLTLPLPLAPSLPSSAGKSSAVGFVACGLLGTNLIINWDPLNHTNGWAYNAMVSRVTAAMSSAPAGSKLKGLVWLQVRVEGC